MAKTEIVPNLLFKDNQGCLLKTLRRKPGTTDWWCTGQPDRIGKWLYSEHTITKGILPRNQA